METYTIIFVLQEPKLHRVYRLIGPCQVASPMTDMT